MSASIIGPVAVRRFVLEKVCEQGAGHEHNYDHVTFIHRGRVKILYSYEENGKLVEDESKEFGEGEFVVVKATVRHTIKALEPNTVYFCIFSHRDFDGLVTQEYQGHQKAYE